ncbi:hypothetical protein H6770_04660 [Candidatus Peribacteria bacterium]|nr:hypothetical protein [Candidatus Peribacteria bacterium]
MNELPKTNGWQHYMGFYNSLSDADQKALVLMTSARNPVPPRSLQALFLGEKPMCFVSQYPESVRDAIRNSGFIVGENYAGNPDEMARIIQSHSDVFSDLPSDPAQLLNTIDKASNAELAIPRGLLLGFPRSAVEVFNTGSELAAFGVDDYSWVDTPNSAVSTERERNLRAVFETIDNRQ